jgi:predicted MFS family arabinose efflux permease
MSSTSDSPTRTPRPWRPAPRLHVDAHDPDGSGPRADCRSSLPLLPLLVLAAVGFVSVTTELLPAGLLPDIGAEFGVGESATGLLTAGYAAIIVVSVIPIMALTSRVPRRMLLLVGLAAFVAGNLLLAASPTFATALVARLVSGVAHGMVWALMAPYVARIVPEGKVGRGMAIVFAGNSVGAAAGAPLGTALGEAMGWRAAFVALAVAVAVLGALVAVVVPRAPGIEESASRSVITVVRRPGVAAITVAWPLLLVAHFAMLTYIAPFLEHARLPDAATSFSLSLLGVAGLAGIWLAGVTVDTIPRRSLVLATAVLVLAFIALSVFGASLIATLVLVAIWGAAFAATAVYNQAALLNAAGPLKDAATSLIVVATQLGIAVGAVYGGVALDGTGVSAVPIAAALPAAAALAIAVLVRRTAYPPGPGERDGAGARAEPDPASPPHTTVPAVHRAARHRSAAPAPAPARTR